VAIIPALLVAAVLVVVALAPGPDPPPAVPVTLTALPVPVVAVVAPARAGRRSRLAARSRRPGLVGTRGRRPLGSLVLRRVGLRWNRCRQGRGGRTGRGSGLATGGLADGVRAAGGSPDGVRATAGCWRAGWRCTATTTLAWPSSPAGAAALSGRVVDRWRGGGAAAASLGRPPDRLARLSRGGSTWITSGRPRSGIAGSSSSATGWLIDSASSSLVATMAANDVAASDATPKATTSEALRRDDT